VSLPNGVVFVAAHLSPVGQKNIRWLAMPLPLPAVMLNSSKQMRWSWLPPSITTKPSRGCENAKPTWWPWPLALVTMPMAPNTGASNCSKCGLRTIAGTPFSPFFSFSPCTW